MNGEAPDDLDLAARVVELLLDLQAGRIFADVDALAGQADLVSAFVAERLDPDNEPAIARRTLGEIDVQRVLALVDLAAATLRRPGWLPVQVGRAVWRDVGWADEDELLAEVDEVLALLVSAPEGDSFSGTGSGKTPRSGACLSPPTGPDPVTHLRGQR